MKRKIILIILGIFELFFLRQWLVCVRFADNFHFSPFGMSLRLIEAIYNDGGVPLVFVRIFHNKILGTVVDIYDSYLRYWDLVFLISLFSFVGLFGLIFYIGYLFQGRLAKWARVLFVIGLIMPIFETLFVFQFTIILQLGFLASPLLMMSFVGWWNFLAVEKSSRYGLFIILEILSILWLFSVPTQLRPMLCLK